MCNTRMCVYLIKCDCGLCYVGSTQRKLRVRVTEHRSRIRSGVLDAPIVQHLVDKNHISDSFKFIVLEIIAQIDDKQGDIHVKLVQQDLYWIYKLCTMYPYGLNPSIDFLACL